MITVFLCTWLLLLSYIIFYFNFWFKGLVTSLHLLTRVEFFSVRLVLLWGATLFHCHSPWWCTVLDPCEVKVIQSCPTLCNLMDYTVHGILQTRILEWVAFPFSRGSSQPRDWTQISLFAGNSLPAEPQERPKDTGRDSLSLLQWIFPTQESNQGLLHCRQIDSLPTELSGKPHEQENSP